MAVELVSIHVPKTAGTSFRKTLEVAYGPEAVLAHYADDPVNPCGRRTIDPDGYRERLRAAPIDARVRVIHGHLHAGSYDHIDGARRITFLREPVENLISIHYYLRALPLDRPEASPLFHYIRGNDLSLIELARLPTFRRLYSHIYFGGVDLEAFDYIGLTETYAEDLARLSDLLGRPLVEQGTNRNPHPSYADEAQAVRDDPRVMARLRDLLAEDLRFYDRARALADRHRGAVRPDDAGRRAAG